MHRRRSAKTIPFETLLRFRATIDNIDAALVYLLAERFRATKQVGQPEGEARDAALRPGS